MNIASWDFAVDQPPSDPKPAAPTSSSIPDAKRLSPAEVLIESKRIRLYGSIPNKNRVSVYLRNLLEQDGKLLIHYNIQNGTDKSYTPGKPQVLALRAPRYRRESLYTLSDTQLSPDAVSHLKSDGQTELEVATSELSADSLAPGQEASGIIAVRVPPRSQTQSSVLRIVFLAGSSGTEISATLVL
jgi:hypothetical protein